MTDPDDHRDARPARSEFDEPPPQQPTRPDLEARPDLQPPVVAQQQPHPMHHAPEPEYGPYGPPRPDKRMGTLPLVIVVAVLMVGGAAAGYFLFGDRDADGRTGTAAPQASASAEASAEPTQEPEASDEAPAFEFSGETIPFDRLGAEMPVPSDRWTLAAGPGEDFADLRDASSYFIQYEDNWFANFQVGLYTVPDLPYDASDLAGTAAELAGFWADEAATAGTNGTRTDTETREITVDDRPAVIAESTASWEDSEVTVDTYEHVVVLIVDLDGVNAFYALAFVPEAAEDEYEALLAAFQALAFTG